MEAKDQHWLKRCQPLALVAGTALLAAPNEFAKSVLETRLLKAITDALDHELGGPIRIAITVDSSTDSAAPQPAPRPRPDRPQQPLAYPEPPRHGYDEGPRMRRAYPDYPAAPPRPEQGGWPQPGGGAYGHGVPAEPDSWQRPVHAYGEPDPYPQRTDWQAQPPAAEHLPAAPGRHGEAPGRGQHHREDRDERPGRPGAPASGRRRPSPASRPPGSTPSTSSTPSSSGRATGSRTPPRSRSPRRRPRRTTRCSSTASRAWARRTCCTPSGTMPAASTPAPGCGT